MKIIACILMLSVCAGLACAATLDEVPSWAYPLNPPGAGGGQAKDDGTVFHVPNSSVGMTKTEIAGRDAVPDWHPEDHPAMPAVVQHGRDGVRACAYCHQPTGVGRPENASLAGLTPGYIKKQVANFKAGARPGSEPKRVPQNLMASLAAKATPAEIEEAAAYFSSLKPVSFVRVVEADTVPKIYVTGGMMAKAPEDGTEAIGNRIVEMPEDTDRAELRDSRTPFVAYVPKGSLERGQMLVTTGGNGKTQQCVSCHGADLHGVDDVPRLAGRSPSYIVRQLYDIQHGKRSGGIAPMQAVVENLDTSDMIAIAAYVASREP